MLTRLLIFLLTGLAAISFALTAEAEEERVWKTGDGKYKVTAELLDADDKSVSLKRADGETVSVPLSRLSNDDIQYLRQWRALRDAPAVPGIIPDVLGEPVDLLELIDPSKHVISGSIQRQGDSLVTDPEKRTIVRVPYELPLQYQLRMVLRRTESSTAMSAAVVVDGQHQGLVVLDSGYGKKSGLVWIDTRNEPNNETFYRRSVFNNGETFEFIVNVHRRHIHVTRDAQTIIQWCGDPARLTLDQRWWSGVPSDELMIGSYASPYEFIELELRPVEATEMDQLEVRAKPPEPSQAVALIEHPSASGTGFLAAPNLLVTNAHVIDGAKTDELQVYFPRQSEPLPVHAVLWVDPERDLAILSVQSERLPLPVAQDGHYARGDTVKILGNPSMGGGAVIRNAQVDGTLRSTLRIRNVDLIQIDANINSGSSGGPILNGLGQVVGVTVMKATEEGESVIRQGLRRLDDSVSTRSNENEDRGIALAVPGRDMVSALDKVRNMSFADAARTSDLHDAQTIYQRLVILAEIHKLGAMANVPDQMRRQSLATASGIGLMPAAAAREVRLLLESEPIRALVAHCERELSPSVNELVGSDYLPWALRRDMRVMYQRVRELAELESDPGTDYRRFSATITRIQESLERLQPRLESSL